MKFSTIIARCSREHRPHQAGRGAPCEGGVGRSAPSGCSAAAAGRGVAQRGHEARPRLRRGARAGGGVVHRSNATPAPAGDAARSARPVRTGWRRGLETAGAGGAAAAAHGQTRGGLATVLCGGAAGRKGAEAARGAGEVGTGRSRGQLKWARATQAAAGLACAAGARACGAAAGARAAVQSRGMRGKRGGGAQVRPLSGAAALWVLASPGSPGRRSQHGRNGPASARAATRRGRVRRRGGAGGGEAVARHPLPPPRHTSAKGRPRGGAAGRSGQLAGLKAAPVEY
jgi:hypothetical protein